jgi:peptide/nickel transport system ATP-binding protein
MILQASGISKSFGSMRVLRDIGFDISAREILSIVGESGCGKTTLAKILAGLIKQDTGQVKTAGPIQMVFQDPYSSLDPIYPVQAILDEAFYRQKNLGRAARAAEMEEMLLNVGLGTDVLERFPHEFSGGQRQRIAIARALLARPRVLVLDEVTSALDVLVQKQILDLLLKLKARFGLTYILISHNLRVVKNFSDTIIVMRAGEIVESGRAKKVFAQPQHTYTQQLLKAALTYQLE